MAIRQLASEIEENLHSIRQRMDAACEKVGRDTESVKLVGVSKTFPVPNIRAAFEAGLRVFGENKAQELRDKASVLPGMIEGGDIVWHYIGTLQKNKTRYIAQHADWIESLDSLSVAKELDKRLKRLNRTIECLVQINVSGEQSKSGIEPSEAVAFIDQLSHFESLMLRGLMTIPAFESDPENVRPQFSRVRKLRNTLEVSLGIDLPELSMGMSHDFEVAIEEGATIIRVGTALFGSRSYAVLHA